MKNDIVPVFLFFDRTELDEQRLLMYNAMKEYAEKYGIQSISVYGNDNPNSFLRDGVHTNEVGARLYGEKILEFLATCTPTIPVEFPPCRFSRPIKEMEINKKVQSHIVLRGNNISIVSMLLKLGPHAGIIDLDGKSYYNTWDQWCYYERENIKVSNVIKFSGEFHIQVTDKEIDRSSCKKVDIDWSVKKYLDIVSIFYHEDDGFSYQVDDEEVIYARSK